MKLEFFVKYDGEDFANVEIEGRNQTLTILRKAEGLFDDWRMRRAVFREIKLFAKAEEGFSDDKLMKNDPDYQPASRSVKLFGPKAQSKRA